MSDLGEDNELKVSVEDELNTMRGYKGTLNNPKVTNEAKHNAIDIISNEIGWDPPPHHFPSASGNHSRDSDGPAGGSTRAQQNVYNNDQDIEEPVEQHKHYTGQ
ncbi:hypothetical protein N7467_011435 [Penicillium canescens]|nr:hypothetical protein N7467_011435 [Penicillium canescens]